MNVLKRILGIHSPSEYSKQLSEDCSKCFIEGMNSLTEEEKLRFQEQIQRMLEGADNDSNN